MRRTFAQVLSVSRVNTSRTRSCFLSVIWAGSKPFSVTRTSIVLSGTSTKACGATAGSGAFSCLFSPRVERRPCAKVGDAGSSPARTTVMMGRFERSVTLAERSGTRLGVQASAGIDEPVVEEPSGRALPGDRERRRLACHLRRDRYRIGSAPATRDCELGVFAVLEPAAIRRQAQPDFGHHIARRRAASQLHRSVVALRRELRLVAVKETEQSRRGPQWYAEQGERRRDVSRRCRSRVGSGRIQRVQQGVSEEYTIELGGRRDVGGGADRRCASLDG